MQSVSVNTQLETENMNKETDVEQYIICDCVFIG